MLLSKQTLWALSEGNKWPVTEERKVSEDTKQNDWQHMYEHLHKETLSHFDWYTSHIERLLYVAPSGVNTTNDINNL